MSGEKKVSIGRGLDALFAHDSSKSTPRHSVLLDVGKLKKGRYQTRVVEQNGALRDLTESIRLHGVIQPILVRTCGEKGEYEIIAGHRRWHAAKLAGLNRVPAQVQNIDERTVAAFTIIENVQRENLNAIEEARAYQKLADDFRLTHDEVARHVGKPRATISNFLRLLRLEESVRQGLIEKKFDMGHAKVLLTLGPDEQRTIGGEIVRKGLSVRQTEALVRRLQNPLSGEGASVDDEERGRADELARSFSRAFGKNVRVSLKPNGAGRLDFGFDSLEELETLLDGLRRRERLFE